MLRVGIDAHRDESQTCKRQENAYTPVRNDIRSQEQCPLPSGGLTDSGQRTCPDTYFTTLCVFFLHVQVVSQFTVMLKGTTPPNEIDSEFLYSTDQSLLVA